MENLVIFQTIALPGAGEGSNTSKSFDRAVENFKCMNVAATHRGYDVALFADITKHPAQEYIQHYKPTLFFGYDICSVSGVTGFHPVHLWTHFITPLLHFYKTCRKKYDYYHSIEYDNYSSDWGHYFDVLAKQREYFIPVRLFEHPKVPVKKGNGDGICDIFETFYGMWDDIELSSQYAANCGNARYSQECLDILTEGYPLKWPHRFAEVKIATIIVNAGLTVNTLKTLGVDDRFVVKSEHGHPLQIKKVWEFPV